MLATDHKDILAFQTLHDVASCQRHATVILKRTLDGAIINAFFKKLGRAALSDTAKRWVIITFVNAMVHRTPASESPPYEAFIDAAVQCRAVSAQHFNALMSPIAQPDKAKLEYYIRIMQALVAKRNAAHDDQWMFDLKRDMWKTQDWPEVLVCLKAHDDYRMYEDYPSSYKKRLDRHFITPSAFVEYPLSANEYASIRNAYYTMESMEEHLTDKTPFELRALFQAQHVMLTRDLRNPTHQLNMLAILRHAMRVTTKKYPYFTQMLVVLGLIANPKGRIAQVRTGEGKTVDAMLLVAFLAGQGKRVHWITSSDDLALRDREDATPFFDLLGIPIACISQQEDETTKYHQPVLIGTNTDFEFMRLRDLFKLPADQQLPEKGKDEQWAAFVDEVDNLLLDEGGNAAILAEESPTQRAWLYRPLLDFARHLEDEALTRERVTSLRTTLSALQEGEHSDDVAAISDKQLLRLIKAAYNALHHFTRGKHYVVADAEVNIVDDDNTGAIQEGRRWGRGTHECIEVKEGLQPKTESLTYAAVSHPAFFNERYDAIYGLTGTMGLLEERQEVERLYGIESFDVPHHKPSQRQTLPAQLFKDRETQWEAIALTLTDILRANHPVLILVDAINTSEAFIAFLEEKRFEVQLLNGQQSNDEKKHLIREAGHLRKVTLATNVASRGTDVKLYGEQHPGYYVIVTSYPRNCRVEHQMLGRVARQGEPGICRMMLQAQDAFIRELMPDEADRATLCSTPDFLQHLEPLRIARVKALSEHRIYRAPREKALFNVLLTFAERYRAHLERLQTLSMASLLQNPTTTSTEPLPHPFTKLAARVRALWDQQQASIKTDWTALFNTFKATYTQVLRQKWALFYTQLMDDYTPSLFGVLDADFYELEIFSQYERFAKKELVPYIDNLPQQAHALFWQMVRLYPHEVTFFKQAPNGVLEKQAAPVV